MTTTTRFRTATALLATLTLSTTAWAQDKVDSTDAASQSSKAATVFHEIMDTPDKGVPADLLGKAECVAVFPQVIKAGFVVGGRGGRGVASCRTPLGWSAPIFLNLGGASIGFQIGVQATDFVLLFMNGNGMSSLLSNELTLGGDASVAAGPVGRQVGADTDAKMNAKILSYSRSKGLFAGLELKGVVIKPDTDDMKAIYGADKTAKTILTEADTTAPAAVRSFPAMLARHSSRTSSK